MYELTAQVNDRQVRALTYMTEMKSPQTVSVSIASKDEIVVGNRFAFHTTL